MKCATIVYTSTARCAEDGWDRCFPSSLCSGMTLYQQYWMVYRWWWIRAEHSPSFLCQASAGDV